MVRVLKAELSDRQVDKACVVRLKAMPLNQNVKQRHRVTEAAFKIGPNPMGDFLEVTDGGDHRQHGFDQHTRIPFTSFAELEVGGIPVFLFKTGVAENEHVIGYAVHQVLKSRSIIDIGRVTRPADDQAQMVKQNTQLATHNPAPVRFPFASDLLVTASFAARVDRFDPKRINQPDQRRGRHKTVNPVPMRVEQAKQPRAIRQLGKQMSIIACLPPIEGAVVHLEGTLDNSRSPFWL